jgi:RNA-directed DNA polymerase
MRNSKAWPITKQMVWQAFKDVKVNNGAAGIDEQSIKEFEAELKDNLFILWNRMASGSYFPPAVKQVPIPKGGGKMRMLGIPTVKDRIAQTVVKNYLEPLIDPLFHESSYGYRPKRSAHGALEQARENCWKHDWVIDLDIRGFFDNLDHELVMKALQKHTQEKWILTYTKRWLTAPMADREGVQTPREKGSPQGSCVSPILANLFLHYAFDEWMKKEFPTIQFERYADDLLVHCKTEQQACYILQRITERLNVCKLEVNPDKTKIVYCQDSNRKMKTGRAVIFTFLGYDFKPRKSKSKGGNLFYSFSPAISKQAKKKIQSALRQMKLHLKTRTTLEDIAVQINPKLRGWINYYGKYGKSSLNYVFFYLNERLLKWVGRKYKGYRYSKVKSLTWLNAQVKADRTMFVHWQHGFLP